MTFTLPTLPYAFTALEPHIDAQTMEIHYTKHHQAYLDKLNAHCAENAVDMSIEDILAATDDRTPGVLRNNGGGYHNHCLFWENLTPDENELSGELLDAVTSDFGSVEDCLAQVSSEGVARFGSGWVWLVSDTAGALRVMSTPNQDSPLMQNIYGDGHTIILAIDVWEHAYYLQYQNRRLDYLQAIGHVIDWCVAMDRYTNRSDQS